MQHAHQKGIIHRDLKPTNILIIEVDGHPVPKVIDFGIAKATETPLTAATLVTNYAQLVGTPAYMSPEQADLSGIDVDTRTDIYALGVLLYEIVTGSVPVGKDRLESAAFAEVQRVLWEEEPPPPSKRLTTLGAEMSKVSEALSTTPAKLIEHVRGDLDWIVMKAIDKDRTRRYESATSLGEDIQRFLDHEPVSATPPSRLYSAKKFVRRHRTGVFTGVALGLLLILGLVVSTVQAFRIKAANDRTQAQAEKSRQALVRLVDANGLRHFEENDLFRGLPWFVEALKLDSGHPEREEIHRRRIGIALRHAPLLVNIWHHPEGTASEALFSPNSDRLYLRHRDLGRISVLDPVTGKESRPIDGQGTMRSATLSSDGTKMACAVDSEVRIWDTENFDLQMIGPHEGTVRAAKFHPDGSRLMSASDDGNVRLWNLSTGEELARLEMGAEARAAAFDPQGKLIVAGGKTSSVRAWDADSFKLLYESPFAARGAIDDMSFSDDGGSFLAQGGHGIVAYDSMTGSPLSEPLYHEGLWIFDALFDPSGGSVISSGRDSLVRIRSVKTGRAVFPPLRHGSGIRHVEFSPDGRHLLSACADNMARIWNPSNGTLATTPLNHREGVDSAAYSPDQTHLVTCSNHSTRLWSFANAAPAHRIVRLANARRAAFSPDGRYLIVVDNFNRVRRFDITTGIDIGDVSSIDPLSIPLFQRAEIRNPAHPDGVRRVAIDRNSAVVIDSSTGAALSARMTHSEVILFAQFSDDGRMVAMGGSDQAARVWDVETGTPLTPLLPGDGSTLGGVFSPGAERIATFTNGRSFAIWDIRPDPRPIADLELLSEVLSERKIDPLQGSVLVEAESFAARDWSHVASLVRGAQPTRSQVANWLWNSALQSNDTKILEHPMLRTQPDLRAQLAYQLGHWQAFDDGPSGKTTAAPLPARNGASGDAARR